MTPEPDLYYFCRPSGPVDVPHPVDFLTVAEFVADEPACRQLWELISTQFRTRGKFLTIWQGARFVAVHRDPDGAADGFLLVTTPRRLAEPSGRERTLAIRQPQTQRWPLAFARAKSPGDFMRLVLGKRKRAGGDPAMRLFKPA